jgi:hypothetical protein
VSLTCIRSRLTSAPGARPTHGFAALPVEP